MLLDIPFLESTAWEPALFPVEGSSEFIPDTNEGDEQFDPDIGELR